MHCAQSLEVQAYASMQPSANPITKAFTSPWLLLHDSGTYRRAESSAGFKVAALKKVAGVLAGWPSAVTSGKDVAKVQGVGKASIQKVP